VALQLQPFFCPDLKQQIPITTATASQARYLVRGMDEANEVLCKTYYDCIRQFWLLLASKDWKEAGPRLYTVNQPSRVCCIFDMHLHQ